MDDENILPDGSKLFQKKTTQALISPKFYEHLFIRLHPQIGEKG